MAANSKTLLEAWHLFERILSSWTKSERGSLPVAARIRSSKLYITTTVCFAVFTDIFLYGLIIPILPFALTDRVGVREEDVQQWTSILLAVTGAAVVLVSPALGWLSDQTTSRRLPLLFGLVAMGGSMVMLCVGSSLYIWMAGRILQGVSSAIVWVIGLALLVDTVGANEVGATMGYVSFAMTLGVMGGPLFGGVVYARAGYNPVFYLSFGLIAIDIILRLALIEKKAAERLGLGVFSTGRFNTVALQQLDESGTHAHLPRLGALVSLTGVDSAVENQTNTEGSVRDLQSQPSRRNLPPIFTLLASPRLLVALYGCLVQAALMTAGDSVFPLFVQSTFNWNATGAALIYLAFVIPSLGSPIVGRLTDKYGPRWLVGIGFIGAMPFWVMLVLVDTPSVRQIVLFCALLFMIGLGSTLAFVPLMAEIFKVVEAKERLHPGLFGRRGAYAQAYGLFNVAFAAGGLVGPLWAGFVKEKSGWASMAWSLGTLSVLSAIPSAAWTGGSLWKRRSR